MSTRCQVQVVQTGSWEEKVTLYHHTDGYPEYMIPIIHKAFMFDTKNEYGDSEWWKGRAGKVASLLCWADPGIFEPEEGHNLHGDIEYYYRIHTEDRNSGIDWKVDVYKISRMKPDLDNAKLLHKEESIAELVKLYAKGG